MFCKSTTFFVCFAVLKFVLKGQIPRLWNKNTTCCYVTFYTYPFERSTNSIILLTAFTVQPWFNEYALEPKFWSGDMGVYKMLWSFTGKYLYSNLWCCKLKYLRNLRTKFAKLYTYCQGRRKVWKSGCASSN